MLINPGGESIGRTLTSGNSSPVYEIPMLYNGSLPKYIYICLSINSRNGDGVSICFGDEDLGPASLSNGIAISGWSSGIIINVSGRTHYRAISGSTSDGLTVNLNITQLAGVIPGGSGTS